MQARKKGAGSIQRPVCIECQNNCFDERTAKMQFRGNYTTINKVGLPAFLFKKNKCSLNFCIVSYTCFSCVCEIAMLLGFCLYCCSEEECAQKPCKAQIAISGKVELPDCTLSPFNCYVTQYRCEDTIRVERL